MGHGWEEMLEAISFYYTNCLFRATFNLETPLIHSFSDLDNKCQRFSGTYVQMVINHGTTKD